MDPTCAQLHSPLVKRSEGIRASADANGESIDLVSELAVTLFDFFDSKYDLPWIDQVANSRAHHRRQLGGVPDPESVHLARNQLAQQYEFIKRWHGERRRQ
jgi:hypothetical protein